MADLFNISLCHAYKGKPDSFKNILYKENLSFKHAVLLAFQICFDSDDPRIMVVVSKSGSNLPSVIFRPRVSK